MNIFTGIRIILTILLFTALLCNHIDVLTFQYNIKIGMFKNLPADFILSV